MGIFGAFVLPWDLSLVILLMKENTRLFHCFPTTHSLDPWSMSGQSHFPLTGVTWKKKKKRTTSKLRIMFHLVDKTEDLSVGHSPSESSERLLQRGEGGTRLYKNFCNKEQVVGTSKDYWLPKKTGYLKLMNLTWGISRCKSLGSLESFLWYAP